MTDNVPQDALARHLWAEFATGTTGGRTFDEQEPSVRNWWIGQASDALRLLAHAPALASPAPEEKP